MAGCGAVMLALSWLATAFSRRGSLEKQRWLLWPVALSFPLGFIAVLAGWFVAEVGRQPWTVWGVLRTADALTPGLSTNFAAASLAMYVLVYTFIFLFGVYYIVRIVRHGVFSGAVLTMWNGHVIPLTYHGLQPQPQPVKAVRRHPNA
jgi:cytochrome d ubiquinol oxidase subunit I